ncbi:multidrug ABC transporter permease/ATP-binding protein, partial [Escherichia coli]|nr:multidrug ABC transporter permease/ATP-binding protein [Escherichia coli]
VWTGQLSIGQLTSFSMYLGQLIWPMFAAGWVLSLLERGRAAWARLDPLLQALPSVADDGQVEQIHAERMDIDHLGFHYPGQE